MIINYPTGLYNLFGNIQDTANVTWYISNNQPPRSGNVIFKIPPAEELRNLVPATINKKDRRNVYGDLIYTINEASNSVAYSGKKQYCEGDILDFSDTSIVDIDIPRGKKIIHRHDLNELDTESIGFDDDDINKFNSDVYDKKEELEQEYLLLREDVENLEIFIKETQKKVNESNKALNAIVVLGDEDLNNKISSKKEEYETELNNLVNEHKEKSEQLSTIVDNLYKIDMVAK